VEAGGNGLQSLCGPVERLGRGRLARAGEARIETIYEQGLAYHLFGGNMGIEYIIVNHDKKEFLDFDRLGFGTKLGSITSEPISSFMSWLLVNPEGYGNDAPNMLGRWASERIEIIGDDGSGYETQERARKDFRDITVEVIKAFADENPFERITKLQPMGLIDKDGNVVTDSKVRDAVSQYWKQQAEQEDKELDGYIAEHGAAPNGGPATRLGNSGVAEGSPSVS